MICKPNELIPAQSIESVVATYADAKAKIAEALAVVNAQHNRLKQSLGDSYGLRIETRGLDFANPARELKELDRGAWKVIIDRSGIRKFLSVAEATRLDQQLERQPGGNLQESLPDITVDTVKATLESHRAAAPGYLKAAVIEVHNWLRPRRSALKTNSEFDIGKKVILCGVVTPSYSSGLFRVGLYRGANFRALDNVWSLLAGEKENSESYYGPLHDAIEKAESGVGETRHFRFRCYANGNIHLEFKDLSIVAKLNAIAGGNALYAKTGGAK